MCRTAIPLLLVVSGMAAAQPTGAELVVGDLVRPIGVTTDAQARIWVAETGTGQSVDDGQITVVLPSGQTFPFLIGLPSDPFPEGYRSVAHLTLSADDLWFTSAGAGPLNTRLNRISVSGFTPGDAPRTPADIGLVVDIGAFMGSNGFTVSNPYGVAVGPDNAIYVTDAGANVLLRYDPTASSLSIHTVFPANPNFSEAVPTGVVSADGRLYVAQLTGFPFEPGTARVFAVEMDGSFTIHDSGLTALTDIARDPRAGGALTVLQHGTFALDPPPPHWLAGTGLAFRLADDRVLASGFDFAAGAAYDPAGLLYVTTLGGELYRVQSNPVASEPGPASAAPRIDVRPNPAHGSTAIRFVIGQPDRARVTIHDVLGREVGVVTDGQRSTGEHEMNLDVTHFTPGIYLVRLSSGSQTATRRLTVIH